MAVVDEELAFLAEEPETFSQDQRAELGLGALVVGVIVILLAMVAFIVKEAWPSFSHNGFAWFGAGGNVDSQIQAIFNSGDLNQAPQYLIRAWPLIWSTILTTGFSVAIAFVSSLFIAVFMVEFAPEPIKRVLEPAVRLLASVPSVIFGLIGVLVVAPFIGNHLITQHEKASVTPVIQLNGYSLLAAVVILTVMIAPIMIAIFAEGLRSVPRGWLEGSLALGVNRWRTFWKIAVHAARPALIAGTVLATARALGEAVMLSMVSGSVGFSPNPWDGLIFVFEPSRGLAATILHNTDELSSPPMRATLFAFAAVLLFSSLMLSLSGWANQAADESLLPDRRGGAMSDAHATPGLTPPVGPAGPAGQRDAGASAAWRLSDRLGLGLAWFFGLLFCAICASIIVFLAIEGIRNLHLDWLWTNPSINLSTDAEAGGFFDPLIGTLIVAGIGIAIAGPIGVGVAVWLSEYGRPAALARVVESTIEMFAGAPSVVLALFGVLIFERKVLAFLSATNGGIVFGKSFFAAGAILSLLGLPLVVATVREGLQAIPNHVREASYALGKTKITTIRRVLLPAARPSVITGNMLAIGHMIGDTAIIVLLLGDTQVIQPVGGVPLLGALRGTGSTLTSYIFDNAPTGDLNQPQKAYAAAFVLILIVLALNVIVDIFGRRAREVRWA